MMSVWEHVDRTYCGDFIILAQDFKVACLRGRVAYQKLEEE